MSIYPMEILDMEILKEIEERAAAATVAPWDNRCANGLDNMARPRHIWTEYGFICELKSPLNSSVADAEFIAHARTDVPRLVEALRFVMADHPGKYNIEATVQNILEGK